MVKVQKITRDRGECSLWYKKCIESTVKVLFMRIIEKLSDMVVDLETQLVKRKISVIVGARASVQDCSTCRYNVEVGLLAWL